MTREWEPGDVALIEAGCHANRRVAVRTGTPSNMGWAYSDTFDGRSTQTWTADSHGTVSVVRQLVVIDPEDRDQVERLTAAMRANGWTGIDDEAPDDMQTVLRSLIADPKPEEPTGLGAVVEDADGDQWVRAARGEFGWMSAASRSWARWASLAVVKIVSDGMPA